MLFRSYLEVPCKALFFTWKPLVRHFFYLEAPCKALFFTWRPLVRLFFYLEIMMMVIMLALVLLFIPLFLFGGPL